VDIQEVTDFDKRIFSADRTELIRGLYESNPEIAWLIRENGLRNVVLFHNVHSKECT